MPKQKVIFRFGTSLEYNALQEKESNALYFLLDTNELYRGTTPFNKPHIYKGLYGDAADLENAIDTIIGDSPVIEGDILVIVNNDETQDAYIWDDTEGWIHIGNTTTESLSERVRIIEEVVADLDAVVNGNPEDPTADDGLVDRVAVLEAIVASQHGGPIPIFNGSTSGLVPVDDPVLTNAEKARHFLNAMGNWVEVSGGSGGQSTYVDPEGNTYNTVEEYVTYMIENYGEQYWESMDPT